MAWSDMEPKQKGMLVASIILFAIIGYMVYKFFFAGSTSPAPVAAAPAPKAAVAAQPQQAAAPTSSPASDLAPNDNSRTAVATSTVNTGSETPASAALGAANTPVAPGAGSAVPGANPATPGVPAPSVPQMVEMPKSELTPEELSVLEERRQVQQQYLELVNQYQLMEMQNKLATSQSTLVKAQLETAKAEQQAAQMGIILPGQQSTESDEDKSLSGVTLVYVGQQNNVWSAVLNLRGQYVTVKQGSHLPDNSVVSKIDDNSIVLYKDGERRILMLSTAVQQISAGTDDDATATGGASSSSAANADASSGDTP